MHITAVRHGETLENAQNIVQGQSYGTLSPAGLEQIAALMQQLADEAFDAIYSSDLERCLVTAMAIAQYQPSRTVQPDERLRERSMKPEEGKHFDELGWGYTDIFHLENKTAEGESWQDVAGRVQKFVVDIASRHTPTDKILLVTHGGPVRALASMLEGQPLADTLKLDIPNCSVWRWDVAVDMSNA